MQDESSIQHTITLENCNIYIENQYQESINFDYIKIIKQAVKELLTVVPCPKADKFEFSMQLSSSETVHQLNKTYRGKDAPTNVLSFEEDLEDQTFSMFEEEFTYIGDIIFAMPIVEQQALDQGKKIEDHFAHLVVHSILHIFGFDHIQENEATVMEEFEIQILKRLEIANPYEIK